MERTVLMAFFLTQIWSIPHLVLLVVGAVFALNYGKQERFVRYAAWCFTLMALSMLLSAGQQYWMMALEDEGVAHSMVAAKAYSVTLVLLNRALDLGGLGLVIAAIVEGRPKKRDAGVA